MPASTNLSATKRTVRALRRLEHITEAHAGLVQAALTTAAALDEVVVSDEKRYVVGQLARAHLLALEALVALPEPAVVDNFDQLFAELATPSFGASDEPGRL